MIKSIRRTLKFIKKHPFASHHRGEANKRYLLWQFTSRLCPYPLIVPFVNNSFLIAQKGLRGATGNIYTGLHEFNDMGFLLHFLRRKDTFFDIGANIGSYTVLVGKGIGARCLSFEPVPTTFEWLIKNIGVNLIQENVTAYNMGLSDQSDKLTFSAELDTVNHVLLENKQGLRTVSVPVKRLMDITEEAPTAIKIDVEGFETKVIEGGLGLLEQPALKAIIIELNGSGSRYGFSEAKIHKQFLDLGFRPYDYFPLERRLSEINHYNTHNTIYLRDVDFVKARLGEAPSFKLWGNEI